MYLVRKQLRNTTWGVLKVDVGFFLGGGIYRFTYFFSCEGPFAKKTPELGRFQKE